MDLRTVKIDVQSQPSIDAAVERVIAEAGRIDVLMHNAGHMVFGPAEAFISPCWTGVRAEMLHRVGMSDLLKPRVLK